MVRREVEVSVRSVTGLGRALALREWCLSLRLSARAVLLYKYYRQRHFYTGGLEISTSLGRPVFAFSAAGMFWECYWQRRFGLSRCGSDAANSSFSRISESGTSVSRGGSSGLINDSNLSWNTRTYTQIKRKVIKDLWMWS